jgi:glycosyltransferase involved in cell wall biosynthesis
MFSSIILLFIGRKYKKIFVFQAGPLTVGIPAIIGKKIFKTTNIIWSLDLWPDTVYMYGFKQSKLNKVLLDRLVKTIYKHFDTIYCSSFAFSQRIKYYVDSIPIHTLLQWPQISIVKTPEGETILEKEYFHFTFTGNIAWTQNLENVILGFSLAQKNNSRIRFNIFGDGSDLERLKNLAIEKGISNVVFWGRKPLKEMPSIYDQSQILVISLQPDPVYDLYIPLKFSTYLAFSKPIFAIMNGVVNDLVENNRIGVTASPSNLEEIRMGFEKLGLMDQNQLNLFSRNSSILLENEFNRKKNIDIIFNMLNISGNK